MLGYDAEPEEVERIVADLHGVCADPLACDPALIPGEHRLLMVYADLQALSRPRLDETDPHADLRSPREHLNAYLRSLDVEQEALPERFLTQLRRALSHYGIDELDRTPELEEACYRLFLAQQRSEETRPAILALLDRRLDQCEALAGHVGEDFREALDRLASAAGRDPILADLALETRFHYFDQPVIEAAAAATYEEAEAHLTSLSADPAGPGRAERIDALVACPRPLAPILSERLRAADPPLRRALLETMTRRYYRMRAFGEFEELELNGRPFLTAIEPHGEGARRVATAYIDLDDLAAAASAIADYARSLPGGGARGGLLR